MDSSAAALGLRQSQFLLHTRCFPQLSSGEMRICRSVDEWLLQIALLFIVFFCPRVQGNPQRRGFRSPAKLFHIEWTLVIDGNNVLPQVDGLANCVCEIVAEPAVRDKRPAAEIDRVDVHFELSELCRWNDGGLITKGR